MRKILLITTDGCYACQIMHSMIKEALENTRVKVEYERKNAKEVSLQYLRHNKIKDFPTVQYIKDDSIKLQTTGTYPSVVVNRYIDVHLK